MGNRSHTTQLVLDSVAVGEGGFETVEEAWHWVLAPLATVWQAVQILAAELIDNRRISGSRARELFRQTVGENGRSTP